MNNDQIKKLRKLLRRVASGWKVVNQKEADLLISKLTVEERKGVHERIRDILDKQLSKNQYSAVHRTVDFLKRYFW